MRVDVYISGVCVEIPDGTDLDTDEGFEVLRSEVQRKLLEQIQIDDFYIDDWQVCNEDDD